MDTQILQRQWLVENHVQLVTIKGDLTAEIVYIDDRETITMMDTLSSPMHRIVDMRQIRSFPSLNAILSLQYLRHQNMGRLLTVGAARSPILRFFLNAVGGATRVQCKDFADVNEAIAFLEQLEPWFKGNIAV
jgi:hypothetical protein